MLASALAPALALAVPAELQEKRAQLEAVEDWLNELQQETDRLAAEYRNREADVERTKDEYAVAEANLQLAERDLAEKKARLADRVVGYYKEQHTSFPVAMQVLMGSESISEAIKAMPFLARLADEDKRLLVEVKGLTAGLVEREKELDRQRLRLEARMRELAAAKEELIAALDKAAAEQKRLQAEVDVLEEAYSLVLKADTARARWRGRVAKSVLRMARDTAFPVNGPHSFINDWGFPRPNDRTHEGTDIMARMGTPVVAVIDGVISRTAYDQPLGGTIIWLRGVNRISYYYAHLSKIAEGIKPGKRVLGGSVIGYVGDTGNAQGGAPHLHFQVHPGGGEPVNPYLLLLVSDRGPR